ncbi:MAG: hypothetical protein OXC19_25355 [Bryobacterales bacterium]|nr:hypothetical protein [Bryobacterales bacterium]
MDEVQNIAWRGVTVWLARNAWGTVPDAKPILEALPCPECAGYGS